MRFLGASVLLRKALNRNLCWGFPLGNLLPKTRVLKHRVLERKRRPNANASVLGTQRFRTLSTTPDFHHSFPLSGAPVVQSYWSPNLWTLKQAFGEAVVETSKNEQRHFSPISRPFPKVSCSLRADFKGQCEIAIWASKILLKFGAVFGSNLFCLQLEASCLQWSFLLTVDHFSIFTYSWRFITYNFSFFVYSWSLFADIGKARLIRALRDCKQRSLTVSKKAPTVRKQASPFEISHGHSQSTLHRHFQHKVK